MIMCRKHASHCNPSSDVHYSHQYPGYKLVPWLQAGAVRMLCSVDVLYRSTHVHIRCM